MRRIFLWSWSHSVTLRSELFIIRFECTHSTVSNPEITTSIIFAVHDSACLYGHRTQNHSKAILFEYRRQKYHKNLLVHPSEHQNFMGIHVHFTVLEPSDHLVWYGISVIGEQLTKLTWLGLNSDQEGCSPSSEQDTALRWLWWATDFLYGGADSIMFWRGNVLWNLPTNKLCT